MNGSMTIVKRFCSTGKGSTVQDRLKNIGTEDLYPFWLGMYSDYCANVDLNFR